MGTRLDYVLWGKRVSVIAACCYLLLANATLVTWRPVSNDCWQRWEYKDTVNGKIVL